MNNYSIPKPEYPIAAKMLAAIVIIALLGLGLVAYQVFGLIDTPVVAGAFALVIEFGAITEAVGIMRRNKPAYVGLIISLLVSGIYNYTRAQQQSILLATPLGDLQLWALSIGPLSATLFLALSLGHEVNGYEKRLSEWYMNRQSWVDYQEQQRREAERVLAEHEQAREVELKRLELEQSQRIRELELKADERRTKLELHAQKIEPAHDVGRTSMKVPRRNYTDFVELLQSNGSHEWKNAELSKRLGVSTRTITDWRKRYQQEYQAIFGVSNRRDA